MKSKKHPQIIRNTRSLSQNNRSFSDKAILKNTAAVQLKLKREIDQKFNKQSRRDQYNQSTVISRRKTSASLLANNPLTKSVYSMNDTITHKATLKQVCLPFQSEVHSHLSSRKRVQLSYRERYNSSVDSQFFQTRAENVENTPLTPRLKPSLSAKQVLPRRESISNNFRSTVQDRRNKFKLLFRQKKSTYKTVSERKITRIDTKIQTLKEKKTYLKSLMPRQKPKALNNAAKPRGQIIKRQKIMTLTLNIIKYLELYFNMYQHNNIVGGHLKNIEGFTSKIKSILMMDNIRAKRISNVEQITNLFWIFKQEKKRPLFFGEEDLSLFNLLNGFYLKMQKKYVQTLKKFKYFQNRKCKEQKQAFKKTYEKFQKKMGKHEPINKINKFIEQRLRHDQSRREEAMIGLQKRGVTLNLVQRSRELVLRQKQKAIKNSIQSLGN